MSRQARRLIAAVALLLVIGACRGDSTVASDSNESDGWVVVEVDARPGTGQEPGVVVGPGGEVGVAYLRQLRGDRFALNWSYCEDVGCEAMSHTTLGTGSLHLAWRDRALWSPEGIVILGSAMDPEGRSSGILWSCAESSCESANETVIGKSPIGLTGRTDQTPVIAYTEWNASNNNYDVFAGICDDALCATTGSVSIYTTISAGYGSPEIKSLPDGSPVLFLEEGAGPGGGAWTVVACADTACSSAAAYHQNPSWGSDTSPPVGDLPYTLYTMGPEIHQLYCMDRACSSVADRTLHTVAGTTDVGHVYGSHVGDNLFLLYQTSTGEVRGDYLVWDLNLLRCSGENCEPIAGVPFGEGFQASMHTRGEATLAIAIQSGRPGMCFEDCGNDPHDLSRLTLYLKDFTSE